MTTSETLKNTTRFEEAYSSLLDQASAHAFEYIRGLDDRPVFPSSDALANLAEFNEPLPSGPTDPSRVLDMLHRLGSPATVAQLGGRYFGFVNGGALPPALAAKWLADVWDQNAALNVISPVNSRLETVCEAWIADLLGLPGDIAAGYVSGTSSALACAFATARNELLRRQGWDASRKGLFGAPEIDVVVGDQAHATVYKALAFVGLGADRLRKCPVDDHGRIIPGDLPELNDRTLLVLQAGNVNGGGFDPLHEIGELARSANAWVHIDGAFGLWAAASKNRRHLVHGFEMADSWALDAHKTLNAPYDSGLILCRHREALVTALQASGSYIQTSDARDPMFYTFEMSRRARVIELWAILKSLGRQGVEDLVEQLCDGARYFADRLEEAGFTVMNDVVFNQLIVACDTPDQTKRVLAEVQSSGELWVGGAEWHGQPVIRVSVCSWATSKEDIARSVAAFTAAREVVIG